MSDIILYGRGKTGMSLQKMVEGMGYKPIFYDDECGFDNEEKFQKDSLVIVSPGVKPNARGMMLARSVGAKTVGELDFCFPYCKGRCVSVTGTNGKTTTCQIIHHILSKAGIASRLLGNGGVPFSSQVLDTLPNEVTVLESSSFQLDNAESFSPYISVLTNLAPDHLDYHGDFVSYEKAKRNNFCHQRADAYAVFNADDEKALEISADSGAYTLYYSTNNKFANCYYNDRTVHLNVGGKTVNYLCDYLSTLAKHNLSNALCGILVCYLLGVDVERSCQAVADYKFLPHRLQTVKRFFGVTFVDDSKATNAHATVSALSCFENVPLALILGGSDKGCSFDEIFVSLKSNVKFVCAVGQTAERINQTAKKYFVNVKVCENYKQAVEACYRKIKKIGGVVLMSNACASFDQFNGYEQRGEYFAQLVEELCSDQEKN